MLPKKLYKKLLSLFAVLTLVFCLVTDTSAAPGDLDLTFGNGGIVITPGYSPWLYLPADIAIQADGKIIAVGDGAPQGGASWDFAVVRYNTNGSLDTSFGGTGKVVTSVGGSHDGAFSVAIQKDGKIIAAGYSYGGGFALVRYNPDSSLDTTFNGTGIVTTLVGDGYDGAFSVAIQPDGKIVTAGEAGGDFALVRYNADGSLDTSFNGTGKVITSIGNSHDQASSVAIQTDGKIVIAGSSDNATAGSSFAVARYTVSGQLDTSFGGTGTVTTSFGDAFGGAKSIAIQLDGKIVAAGYSDRYPNSDFTLIRYLTNGQLDTSFGGTGRVITPVGSFDLANSVAIQPDGKIVAAGLADWKFAVVRVNSNGTLDTTFNGTGKVITVTTGDEAFSVAIQADGKIVVSGCNTQLPRDGFILVRYQSGISRSDFDGDGRSDVSVFRPTETVWYLDRSSAGFTAVQFGLPTDMITPADFDGDGKTDIAVYRDGTWWRLNSGNSTVSAVQFGIAGDVPVPADYTGDGLDDLAVYRNGDWWTFDLSKGEASLAYFGLPTDKPVPADYDGDGRTDHAVYRNGEWHLNRSTQGYAVVNFGLAGDPPLIGDFDGDSKADLAVYRNGTWYLLRSAEGFTAFPFGLATDTPVPADYDGDGKTDAAVYRNGTWYVQKSTGGVLIQQFGLAGDLPTAAAYLP